MEKEITGVHDLLGKITEEPSKPGARLLEEKGDQLYGMKSPSWGPPASLDAGDAGSRLGIDMGEPTVKAAALRHALLHDEDASLEKIALLPLIGRAVGAGKKLFSGAQKALGLANKPGQASRGWFAKRRAAAKASKQEAKAGRLAAHQKKVEGMDPSAARRANAAFKAKEVGRAAGGPALGAAGLTLSVSDMEHGTRPLRNTGSFGFGHG